MFVLLLLAEQGLQGLQDPAGSSTAAKGDKLSEQSHWRSPHWLLTEHRIADEESLGAGFFFLWTKWIFRINLYLCLYIVVKGYERLVYPNIHSSFLICLKLIVVFSLFGLFFLIKTHREGYWAWDTYCCVKHNIWIFNCQGTQIPTWEHSSHGKGRRNQFYISCPELILCKGEKLPPCEFWQCFYVLLKAHWEQHNVMEALELFYIF